jgi:ubiquinone biosynthesis protein COQ9
MADPIPPAEMTLDELRLALAPLIPKHAVFDGWSDEALAMAAAELGVPAPRARLAFRGGAPDMIDAWFDAIDRASALHFPLEKIEGMWRIAGDRSTDFNHYTKRVILMGVYGSTSLVFLDDDSEDLAATRAFLDRRIDDVMQFEKVKAQWRGSRERMPSLSRFLGRLRYPAA